MSDQETPQTDAEPTVQVHEAGLHQVEYFHARAAAKIAIGPVWEPSPLDVEYFNRRTNREGEIDG
jgi:hypothetical protein